MGIHNTALIGASGQGGYFINNSLRFRSSASAYLNRTPASATNRQIWTYSTWLKRSNLTTGDATIISARADDNNRLFYSFGGGGAIDFFHNVSGTAYQVSTTALFRDPSAWYHFVIAVDTTQATAANRIKFYVNGVQLTLTVTTNGFPPQNTSTQWNNAVVHTIAKKDTAGVYSDCYLTEIYNIDGQQLTPSSFGETDTLTGQWVAKKYTGTYGTNGFYLKFADTSDNTAATIGKDSSGNGNNWTPNAISKTAGVTYDFMTDSPTVGPLASNYAVLSPLIKQYNSSTDFTSDGNLKYTVGANGGATGTVFATIPMPSGKWYAEVYINAAVTAQWIGVCSNLASAGLGMAVAGVRSPGYAYKVNTGNKCNNDNTGTAYAASSTTGDTIGIAMDADAGSITFYKNGTSLGVAFTGMTNTGGGWVFGSDSDPSGSFHWNFGQRPFSYTPPTGYSALNTYNLSAPAIKNGALNMTAALWTANVANPTAGQKSIALGFQPDLVWSKNRSDAEAHYWVDSVRGDNSGSKWLRSNSTAVEGADAVGSTTAKYVFTSTGFDIVDTDSNAGEVYYSTASRTYVGWAWKAGGTAVTNTSGTISSQVSANPTAGFSVVTYTGNGVTAATVGHGLGVAPKMIILKSRNGTSDWEVFHTSLSASNGIRLNSTAGQVAVGSTSGGLMNTSPTSTTFGFIAGTVNVNNVNASAETKVAYCFAAVAGYSAFGSYTGNGSTDGPFVFLGFRPRFVLFKNASDGTRSWYIYDSSRNTYNVTDTYLLPNSSGVESSTTTMDFLSNGFKIRDSATYANGSGNTIIYAAFAETPFKNSLAR